MKTIEQVAINYVKDICPGVFGSVSVDRIIFDKANLYDKSATIMADVFQVWVEIEADIELANPRVVKKS